MNIKQIFNQYGLGIGCGILYASMFVLPIWMSYLTPYLMIPFYVFWVHVHIYILVNQSEYVWTKRDVFFASSQLSFAFLFGFLTVAAIVLLVLYSKNKVEQDGWVATEREMAIYVTIAYSIGVFIFSQIINLISCFISMRRLKKG